MDRLNDPEELSLEQAEVFLGLKPDLAMRPPKKPLPPNLAARQAGIDEEKWLDLVWELQRKQGRNLAPRLPLDKQSPDPKSGKVEK